ncbi:hypothetical protein FGADI_12883 [Fusarium gaditjirri]|uniref:Uncharacterized protein n=1 Tax=Fusarium gaditjirri TaxID=282569 RepID=A0A8H4SR61_9HYPO|nr:hypothetical protein FGADI_12883 [Fusarium gaditjirri]
MPRDNFSSASEASFRPVYNTEWDSTPPLVMPTLQSNALTEYNGWPQFFGPASVLPGVGPDMVANVRDFHYAQRLNDFDTNAFNATDHPSAMKEVENFNQEVTGYMPSVHPNVTEKLDNTLTTNRASSLLGIDLSGASPGFDGGDSTTNSIANTPSSNIGWTKEQDKCLMSLKAQGLGYSAIQDEMRKEFGWTRNKNMLVKRFAALKKRYKPQIKTRVVRDISKRITPEIIKAVGKELEKVTSSGSSNIAAELEDLVPLRLPEFLERLVADVGVSLHQIVEGCPKPFPLQFFQAMTSTRPTLSSAGCVKPWIQKFTNTPRDAFFDQFVDSHDARFVEIIEGHHESEIKYSEIPLDSGNPKSAPDLSRVFELPLQDGSKSILRLIILPFNTENDNAPPLSWKGFSEHLRMLNLEESFVHTEQMKTPPIWFEVPLQSGLKGCSNTGFIIKPERWDSNLANFSIGPHVAQNRRQPSPSSTTDSQSTCLAPSSCASHPDDWLQGLSDSFGELKTKGDSWRRATSSIRMKISAFRTWSGNNRARSIYLAKRAEAQMQACLNLMAQRDNALNLKKTQVALRDSSDMRAIAWVTLAFLPATFVAYLLL